MNLKCDGVVLWDNSQTLRRWEATKDFIAMCVINCSGTNVLDIGPKNTFGQEMAKNFNLGYYHTKGDLDYIWEYDSAQLTFDVIFCFDVIEHLKNPDLFLRKLKTRMKQNTKLYLTYPRNPEWLKSDRHWKEFTDEEFQELIDGVGFEIEYWTCNRGWHNFWFYFTGIRPMIRFWCKLFWLSRNNLYCLKIK